MHREPNHGCCVAAPAPPAPTVAEQYAARGQTHQGPLPTFPTKAAREAFFRSAIAHQPAWAYRALEIIFASQTADEQRAGVTVNRNGVGFTGCDAEFLTSLAKQLARKRERYGRTAYLSPAQQTALQRAMPKYATQLIRVLEARGVPGTEIQRVRRATRKAVA